MSAMGSVELMGWVAVGAGVLFPFSWIPAAVCAGINEKRRLHQAEAASYGHRYRWGWGWHFTRQPTMTSAGVADRESVPVATTPKAAVHLDVGDVIVASDGSRHRVTSWTPYPHLSVVFCTDTGHDIDVPWQDATTNLAYDVEVRRLLCRLSGGD